jgi:hypothetical protein
MGVSPHCLALSKINNRDWIFLKNVGYWIIVWEPWYADICDQRHTQVFCSAHTRFVDLIHHCHSLNTYRESYGVYCSKMGCKVKIKIHFKQVVLMCLDTWTTFRAQKHSKHPISDVFFIFKAQNLVIDIYLYWNIQAWARGMSYEVFNLARAWANRP